MDRYIAFRAQSDLLASLRAAANERGVSVSRVIRDLLSRGVGRDGTGVEGRRA